MSLSREWNNRISNWLGELARHFYRPLGTIELEGFTTFERLSPEEAVGRPFLPMPPGTAWGAKWEYAWFRGSIVLPPEAAGGRVAIRLRPGVEGLVFVDGHCAGARDREHPEITVARRAKPGESHELLAEFYAGHGAIEENIGPVPPDRIPLPEPGPTQRVVEASDFGIWDDDAFSLWIDAETLRQTRSALPETSLRVSEIDASLRDFTRIVDFEQGNEAMRASFRAARQRLRPLLACRNGSTAPVMHIFGNSHLDLAWQWPFEETIRKAARTLSTQLALLDEYPEYRFFWCQVPLFEALRDHYPELWTRLKARIADGSIAADGGMWVEPDTNIPSGESLIRQVMLAKEFFAAELGGDTRVLWLPDSFGFSAALPQIMKGTGLDFFATKKIIDTYNDSDPFPLTTFRWRGLDGSEVLSHIYRKCNSPIDPATLAKRWNQDRVQKDNISDYLFPFGYGDGGGGPTRTHLEFALRLGDLEGNPRTKWSAPLAFFEDIASRGPVEEAYEGELYFQEHRGTYTTQAPIKRANRVAEIALRDAEFWSAAACLVASLTWPRAALRDAWRSLLFNHFHDVITGVAIRRVNEEALSALIKVRSNAEGIARSALDALASGSAREGVAGSEGGLTVFNSLPWERTTLIRLPEGVDGVQDETGVNLPIQACASGHWTELQLPAAGWASFAFVSKTERPAKRMDKVSIRVQGDGFVLENRHLRVTVDRLGRLSSVFDKASGLELAEGPCNEFRMYRDVTTNYDAWDIDSMYKSLPVDLGEGKASLEIVEEGPLFVSLRLSRDLAFSGIVEEIRLTREGRRVEFHAVVDWREDHKLLKVDFPTRLKADDALYEIQFGHVCRPTHGNRRYDADRYEGCHHRWVALEERGRGVAILNDCKYGSSVAGGTMSLTLLKAPWVPDMTADRGRHEFSYAFMVWNGDFAEQGPVREGYDFNVPPLSLSGRMRGRSLLRIDKPSVVIETMKLAEDGSGDLVLRLYESSGGATRARLDLAIGFSETLETDMLERGGIACPRDGQALLLEFRAFEIKTLRLRPRVQ